MQSNYTALVAVLVSFALSTSARPAVSQMPTDPCAQVSAQHVSAALGETVAAGKPGPPPTCTWVANAPKHQIVTLMYSPPGDWNTRKNRPMPGVEKTPVSGVGDEAISMKAGNLVTLYAKKGSTTFMVRVYGVPDPARQLAIETPIAKEVASHL